MGLDIYIRKGTKTSTTHETDLWDETEEFAYWRKFDALHKWFVENVCEGNDDCEYWNIEREKLEEFLSILKSLTPENCDELLPTQSGFFFGSADHDEWYWNDVNKTIPIIETILNETDFENETLWYTASW